MNKPRPNLLSLIAEYLTRHKAVIVDDTIQKDNNGKVQITAAKDEANSTDARNEATAAAAPAAVAETAVVTVNTVEVGILRHHIC